MSTTTEHADHADHEHAAHDAHDATEFAHKPDSYYIKVALILAVITGLETSTYWVDFGPFFLPALLIMMAIKFVMVASLFMHLKFDNKIFSLDVLLGPVPGDRCVRRVPGDVPLLLPDLTRHPTPRLEATCSPRP
jgi:cytochrome c oxidase subunit 4